MYYITKKPLVKGEELLITYGDDYAGTIIPGRANLLPPHIDFKRKSLSTQFMRYSYALLLF